MTKSITVLLSDTEIKAIDSLIKAGLYTTRSDFLRTAAKILIRRDVPIIPEFLIEMQRQTKNNGLTRGKTLKELRKTRKELYNE